MENYEFLAFLAAADFNNDGHQDLAGVNLNTGNIGILVGDGMGSFETMQLLTSHNISGIGSLAANYWLTVGDFNVDGHIDIGFIDLTSCNIGLFLGYGNGVFTTQITLSTRNDLCNSSFVIADFNGDGKQDIAVTIPTKFCVDVMFGYNNGSFEASLILSTGIYSYPSSVVANDFNRDRYLDIVVANTGNHNIGVFLGNGDRSFQAQMIFTTTASYPPVSITAADFNGDGQLDITFTILQLVYGQYTHDFFSTKNFVYVMLGYGNGSFGELIEISTLILSPSYIGVGDFNGDGGFDLILLEDWGIKIYSADCSKQSNKIDFLLTNFDIRQCTRLNSLTLLDIDNIKLDRFLSYITVLPLISLSIQFYHASHRVPTPSLSKAIIKWNLQQLHLINESYITTILSWPIPCPLYHLTIDTCTYTEFMYILGHSPFLRTFTMKNCIGMNSAHSIDVSYPQLTSLIINFCYLSFKNLNLLLSYTPSITYLKLIIYGAELDSLFDGSQWEEFIQTKLPFLNKFHFCFRHTIQKNYEKYISIDSIINQYRTPFWLEKKRWFVTCDCVMRSSLSEIILYTIPVPIQDSKIFIRYNALSMNNICYLTEHALEENGIAVSEEKTLSTLYIDENQIGIEGAQHLANILQKNTTLTTLSIGENQIGDEGMRHSLHVLDLSSNQLKMSNAQYFASMLENNTTLITLDLRDNKLRSKGIEFIADALKKNKTLRILNLRFNHIDDDGAEYLADTLITNKTLATLNLWNNDITGIGVRSLANALQKNTALTTLDLGRNRIGSDGTKYLGNMLRINSVLTTLNLWDNQIKGKGAKYLANALEINR
ncbi:unnamed protein product, partial [Adineta steineri]